MWKKPADGFTNISTEKRLQDVSRVGWRFCAGTWNDRNRRRAKYYPTLTREKTDNRGLAKGTPDLCPCVYKLLSKSIERKGRKSDSGIGYAFFRSG